MNEKLPYGASKEKHARIGREQHLKDKETGGILIPIKETGSPYTTSERCKESALFSHYALATANFCFAILLVWMFWVLNQKLELYTPGELMSNIRSFCNTYIPIPESFLETIESASPILIFAIFWIAALAFSVTLMAWFFTNASLNRKQPNKFLGTTFVFVGLSLEIWAGVTVEEFCLVAMPITTSMGLIFGSIV